MEVRSEGWDGSGRGRVQFLTPYRRVYEVLLRLRMWSLVVDLTVHNVFVVLPNFPNQGNEVFRILREVGGRGLEGNQSVRKVRIQGQRWKGPIKV